MARIKVRLLSTGQTGTIEDWDFNQSIYEKMGENKTLNLAQNVISSNNSNSDLIKKYFPQSQWNNAYRVMMAESSGKSNIPSYYNRYGTEDSWGLFQINLKAHPQMRNKVLNPEENVKYAAELYKHQGWRPWLNSARKLGLL